MGYLVLFPFLALFTLLLSTPLTFEVKKSNDTIFSFSGPILKYQFVSRKAAKRQPPSSQKSAALFIPKKAFWVFCKCVLTHVKNVCVSLDTPKSEKDYVIWQSLVFFSLFLQNPFFLRCFDGASGDFAVKLDISFFHLCFGFLAFLLGSLKKELRRPKNVG